MQRRTLLLTLPLVCISFVSARTYNVTIDDQLGDPTTGEMISYTPAGPWRPSQSCPGCTAKPMPVSDAYMGTWMDATYFPSGSTEANAELLLDASVSFIGTAVYVQCILTRSANHPDGNTDMTFKIDGKVVGTFVQEPTNDKSYQFNVTVFSTAGLENRLHTITLESGNLGQKALVLLDSIIYTKDVPDPSPSVNALSSLAAPHMSSTSSEPLTSTPNAESVISSSASSTGSTSVIAGAVVGGIVAITAIITVACLCHRRQRRQEGGVRVMLDVSDVGASSPMSYDRNSTHPIFHGNNQSRLDTRAIPFILAPPTVHTIAPGDSVSQVSSDNTSDWTSGVGGESWRKTFRERARAFRASRPHTQSSRMKVRNATEADEQELDAGEGSKLPEYMPSKYVVCTEKGRQVR